ncbi:MAG: hypothetical protein IKV36_04010, partial [Clostridia bacterium]|nr:hypothetical protein [Clostridia bacterium]
TATDDGATINLKVTVDAEKATYYINGTVSYELFFTEAESVAPFAALTTRGANVEVSNVTLKGLGAKNCTHTYSNDCDTTCDNCGAIRTVGDHVYDSECDTQCNVCGTTRVVSDDAHKYDNDYDADCNVCGATRTPPATALPTIGNNTNFADKLVFANNDVNNSFFETGSITTAGLNGQAAGVLLNENGVIYVKTDITFNGNVDYNWVGTTDEETGKTTYSYKQAWGRTGVQIGTYYSTGRERRMSVFVTYRRCTGGVYVWDDSQEVNGSGNPVVVGNIANNKETLSFVVRYDSAANNVTVWADGAYVGTASLEAFGEFEFALGVTQYGSGTTAVDPSDNTNGEKTNNSVTFTGFEVWGDVTVDSSIIRNYIDQNGNKVIVERIDTENNDVYVKVIPADGYILKAGTLKLGDKNIINGVNTPENAPGGVIGDGASYVVTYTEGNLSAVFVSKEETSVSADLLGVQTHTNDQGDVDGVRYLNRIYIDGIERDKLQTSNAFTVKYNGETYTVSDYGIICGRAMANPEELSLDNHWKMASGISNYIHSYSENYIDISATVKTKYTDRKYSMRGYITLSNGETIYTDVKTFCINDFANIEQ